MSLPLLIIGAGGHGRVLLEMALLSGREVLGFVDSDSSLWSSTIGCTVSVLGGDDILSRYNILDVMLVNGVGSTSQPKLRAKVYSSQKSRGFVFSTLCHPHSSISVSAQLAEGAQVMAGAVIQTGAEIGENVIVNSGAIIEHDCVIGMHSHLAPGVVLCGGVFIGSGCHIGVGSRIVQGVSVGDGACVAAGAVVVEDVPQGVRVAGVPARPMVIK